MSAIRGCFPEVALSGQPNTRARNAADIAWMQRTFDEAKAHHSAAIMFSSQGDPGFDATDATRGPVRDPKTLVETDSLPATDPAAPSPTPDGFHDFSGCAEAASHCI